MDIKGSVAFVTGANRGLGRRLTEQLVARGAAKVYGGARRVEEVTTPGVIPVRVDLTDTASIEEAAAATGDVTLLINNAGNFTPTALLEGSLEEIRAHMETHFFGTLAVTRAFAPQLTANAPAAILNVGSILSWLHPAGVGAYAAAKAALWAQTNAIREEVQPRGIAVTSLHVGYMDTDMVAAIEAEKNDPTAIAGLALDGVQAGAVEVIADILTEQVKQSLAADRGLNPLTVS
ncbi:SDR family oxidoreductase [Mycolicibacterium sp. GCM10028919]|uniref:SDR family oxidoreductase n=1 Tax=Mycolicibacterium sp. GCM10028919 TaxID=3273401 RepID=UPI0036196C0E